MRVIIGQGSRKRVIEGDFGLCASRDDFRAIRDQIDYWLSEPGNGVGISYGWLPIRATSPRVYGPINSEPEPWEA